MSPLGVFSMGQKGKPFVFARLLALRADRVFRRSPRSQYLAGA